MQPVKEIRKIGQRLTMMRDSSGYRLEHHNGQRAQVIGAAMSLDEANTTWAQWRYKLDGELL